MTAQYLHIRKPVSVPRRQWPIPTLCGCHAGPMAFHDLSRATCPKCVAVALTQPKVAV